MKLKICSILLQVFVVLPIFSQQDLSNKQFSYKNISGIGYEKGVTRRDPSDVIKVNGTCYVYYTKVLGQASGYWGTLWCASSTDEGYHWKEEGMVLDIGEKGTFDSQAVFTPNIIYANGKYYLYYTGVRPTPGRTDGVFENNSTNDYTAIGLAVSDSPVGPFRRISNEPVLRVSTDDSAFDSYRIDDASLLYKDRKYWLYYKGRCIKNGEQGPAHTKMGVAFSDTPEGPFVKYGEPILSCSHEVMIWKENKGIYALASISSMIEFAKDGITFDKQPLHQKVKNRPNAPGAYRPDLTGNKSKNGLTWGISMIHNGNEPYLVRFTWQ